MRIAILFFALGMFLLQASGEEFSRSGKFESMESFVAVLKTLTPDSEKGEISSIFAIKDEDSESKELVFPTGVDSGEVLDANDSSALVLAKAQMPTVANRAVVAIIFLLKREKESWQIADMLRFQATGKYAKITVELTSTKPRSVTVTETQGGRLYCYAVSGSFECSEGKFKRLDLK